MPKLTIKNNLVLLQTIAKIDRVWGESRIVKNGENIPEKMLSKKTDRGINLNLAVKMIRNNVYFN